MSARVKLPSQEEWDAVLSTASTIAISLAAVEADVLALQGDVVAAEAAIATLISDLNTLEALAVPNTRQVISGNGLTGGGDLSADRTLAVGAGTGIIVNANDVQVDSSVVALAATDMIAGTGLTGGGTLAANRTFNVAANADASIVVNANDIQVGVLATDAQHGVRGGGTQHAVATGAAAGFVSAADKTKLDTYAATSATQTVRHSDVLGTLNALLAGTTRATVGTFTNVLVCDNNASEGGIWYWRIPPQWDGSDLVVRCLIAAAGTSGGNVVIAVAFERNDAGVYDLDAGDSFATDVPATVAVSATQGVVSIASVTLTSAQIDGSVAGDFVRIRIRRLGSDGADSNTGSIHMRDEPVVDYRSVLGS